MRDALLVLTLVLLACLSVQVYRLPRTRLSVAFYAYLVCQFLFTAVCLAASRKVGWTSLVYFRCFYGAMLAVSIAALALAFQFGAWLPTLRHFGATLFVVLVFAGWAGLIFLESLRQRGMLTSFAVAHVASACLFVFCGCFGLFSLAFPADITSDAIRFTLSVMWTFVGGEGLLEAGLYLRARADAAGRIALAPTVASLVILGALSLFLFSQQELSRQPAQSHLERAVPALSRFERASRLKKANAE